MDKEVLFSNNIRKFLGKLPVGLAVLGYCKGRITLEAVTDALAKEFNVSTQGTDLTIELFRHIIHPNDLLKLKNFFMTLQIAPGTRMSEVARLRAMDSHDYNWYRIGACAQQIDDDFSLVYAEYANINELQIQSQKNEYDSERSFNLLETILDTTQVPIFWKDKNRRFLGGNKAFRQYFDLLRDEDFIGKNDEEMGFHPDPEVFKNDEEKVLKGNSTYMVHGKCYKGKNIRDILATKNPIYESGKVIGLVGSFFDMTHTFEQEREIKTLNEKLNIALENEKIESQKASDFLAQMNHEIETPVSSIISLANQLKSKEISDECLEDIDKIIASAKYLKHILGDIRELKKGHIDNSSLIFSNTSIDDVLSDVNKIIEPLARQKNIVLKINDRDLVKRNFVGDKQRIDQILVNLLSNAIRFTDDNGHVELELHQKKVGKDIKMTFVVKDNGCGMNPSFLQKIFQPFAQENRNADKYGSGAGLGLTISRYLAKMMHGDIRVESSEGFGSTFIVSIIVGDSNTIEKKNKKKSDIKQLKGKRILIVDDNAINRQVASSILQDVELKADCVEDGESCILTFSKSKDDYYDAILLDLQMPGLNGFEVLQKIRSLQRRDAKSIPIIAMSADVFEESVKNALSQGMDGYLSKPLNQKQVYETLQRLL